jgi:tetratricopeptide (TPR) repeat protein
MGLEDDDWNLTLTALEECGLVLLPTRQGKTSATEFGSTQWVDAHPLIREYFGERLTLLRPEACRAAHDCLFRHLQGRSYLPESLEDVEQLYRAIAHGCRAGLHSEALELVLRARIHRGKAYYSISHHGAIGLELGALAAFFEINGRVRSDSLSREQQAFLFKQRAYCRRSIGLWTEAKNDYETALKLYDGCQMDGAIKVEQADIASHVSHIHFYQCESDLAVKMGEEAVRYAKESCSILRLSISYAFLLDVLLQVCGPKAGEPAAKLALQSALDSEGGPSLSVGISYRYCDWLLAQGRWPDAWRILVENGAQDRQHPHWGPSSHGCRNVVAALVRRQRDNPGDKAKAVALLRRAVNLFRRSGREDWLVHALIEFADAAALNVTSAISLNEAENNLNEAFRIAQDAGMKLYLAGIFISRVRNFGRSRVYPWVSLEEDLTQAWKIAKRGNLRLFMADICLLRALLRRDKAELEKARRMISEYGYWRRKQELEDLEEAANNWV